VDHLKDDAYWIAWLERLRHRADDVTFLAREVSEALPAEVLGPLLLPGEFLELEVARRLARAPMETAGVLERLARSTSSRPSPPAQEIAPAAPPRQPRALNLPESELREVRDLLVAHLQEHPWSTREELARVASRFSATRFRALLAYLKRCGDLVQRGLGQRARFASPGFDDTPPDVLASAGRGGPDGEASPGVGKKRARKDKQKNKKNSKQKNKKRKKRKKGAKNKNNKKDKTRQKQKKNKKRKKRK